jgi:hypothetical protein
MLSTLLPRRVHPRKRPYWTTAVISGTGQQETCSGAAACVRSESRPWRLSSWPGYKGPEGRVAGNDFEKSLRMSNFIQTLVCKVFNVSQRQPH